MNALQCALVNAGLAEPPRQKKYRARKFKCNKCGGDMIPQENTNVMTCTECGNYFIFTKGRNEH